MHLTDQVHLTYCLNVHPGESWADNLEAIRTHTLAIRAQVAPTRPFGLGLRLSAHAARDLAAPGQVEAFRDMLRAHDLYVFTINGFPYGRFHGGRVKERVYLPDWTSDARRAYTDQLADLLAELLPDGQDGSISTVPGGYKLMIRGAEEQEAMARHLADAVAHLAQRHERTGREIHLGLEPEPACFIETTDEFVRFFNDVLLVHGAAHLQSIADCDRATAEMLLRRHLGVCLDTCHAALQFETPHEVIARYQSEGIRLSKIQLSAALEAPNSEPARMALRAFDEPIYLHQTRTRCVDDRVIAWNDLPDALAALPRQPMAETVRVHFHVPLFWEGESPLGSTAHTLDASFWAAVRGGACPHLEIETYTFDVLPPALRAARIEESVVREFEWVMKHLAD